MAENHGHVCLWALQENISEELPDAEVVYGADVQERTASKEGKAMRRAANIDIGQVEIVKQLRSMGMSVMHLHMLGSGAPDLAVGFRNVNTFLELKDGSKPPSARKLTQDEQEWHAKWAGQVTVVSTFKEAVDAVLEQCRRSTAA